MGIHTDLYRGSNVWRQGLVHLTRTAKEAGVGRFVFASSCSSYGAGDTPFDETSELESVTAYGRTKVLVEQDVARVAAERFTPTFLPAQPCTTLAPAEL